MKINEIVRQMHPPRYTVAQAAALVHRDVDTLKRWKRSGVYEASDHRRFGSLDVDLYTDDDIKAMKRIAKEMKPGRKPLAESA